MLRFVAFSGTLASTLFYSTRRVLAINIMACMVNIASQSLIIDFETNDQTKIDLWTTDSDMYGPSPLWFLYANMFLPLLSTVALIWLKDRSGLVLLNPD